MSYFILTNDVAVSTRTYFIHIAMHVSSCRLSVDKLIFCWVCLR